MFDVTSGEARLLLDIALMATGRNRFRSAETILAALDEFRPRAEQLAVARMILAISKGDLQGAVDFADGSALCDHPDSAMIKAFKGMALLRLERTAEAMNVMKEAAEQTGDPVAARLAKDMMI
jgi:Flp pilus assembly protein TadD